jgi:hypothetical protein
MRISATLICGKSIVEHGLRLVLRNTIAMPEANSEVELGIGVALISGEVVAPHGLGFVLHDTIASTQKKPEGYDTPQASTISRRSTGLCVT